LDKLNLTSAKKSNLRAGVLFLEWCRLRDARLTPSLTRKLAKAHFDLFIASGFSGNKYHIERALELYESAIQFNEISHQSTVWLEYCKTLQIYGDIEKALSVCNYMLDNFKLDSDYPSFLFFAGGLYKALNKFEDACNYFLEAAVIGPPKYFSKLELIFVIARCLEESANYSDNDFSDEAYKLVSLYIYM
jgi:tetratricopeptide (TPR) repeat protein